MSKSLLSRFLMSKNYLTVVLSKDGVVSNVYAIGYGILPNNV